MSKGLCGRTIESVAGGMVERAVVPVGEWSECVEMGERPGAVSEQVDGWGIERLPGE